jgi:hypothetical protein
MTRLVLGILVAVLLIAVLGRRALMIKSTAVPMGKPVRVGETIVTLMNRREPYMVSLHRDWGKDRYTIGLLIQSARDTATKEFVTIVTGQRAEDTPLMDIIAVEGNVVWFRAAEVGAYDIGRRKLLAEEPDWSATPPAKQFTTAERTRDERGWIGMLIAGGEPTPTQWLAALNETEITRNWGYGPGASITESMGIERTKEPRRLYISDTYRVNGDLRIRKMEPLGGDSMLNAGFVRAERYGEILNLAGGGFLLLYETPSFLNRTIIAARVDGTGKIVWKVDTGISELQGILPDPAFPALSGEPPIIEEKVPEPRIVVLDAATGQMTIHSLWLRPQ